MAEVEFNNVLNDPETSDGEYSENDDFQSEGEVILLSESDLDEDSDIVQTIRTNRKRPRIKDELEQQNSETEDETSSSNHSIKQKRRRGRPPSHKNDLEISEMNSEIMDKNASIEKPKSKNYRGRNSGNVASIVKGKGENPIKWTLKEPSCQTKLHSVPRLHLPSVVGEAKNAKTPLGAWSYLMSDDIIDMIVLYTNEEITRVSEKIKTQQTYHKKTDDIEVRALIGLLYIAGSRKQNKVDIDDLWEEEFAPNIFRATMSARRFQFLTQCLRFDDKATRAERRRYDRYAAICDIWTKFLANCAAYYSPYQICAIDKQMVGFKGQCIFRTYMPNKSDRYGIKYMMINDAKTNYMFNAIPYLGKVTDNKHNEPVANYFVRKLVKDIRGSGRTVIMDHWFTSVDLFKILDTEYGLNALGIIKQNKKDIPEFILEPAPAKTTKYGFSDKLSLLSYIPKKNDIILVLATGLTSNGTDFSTKKPQLITQYNAHKGATNAFNQACKLYSVSRRTRRWPLKVFYSMLDTANVNSTILYNLVRLENKKTRKIFQKELSLALLKPHLKKRYESLQLRTTIKKTLAILLEIPQPLVQYDTVIELEKRTRCHYCHHSLGVKTKMQCPGCRKPMCCRHRSALCVICEHSKN